VFVDALSEPRQVTTTSDTTTFSNATSSEPTEPAERVPAFVYLWSAPQSRLEPTLWSFDDFLRDKAHRWVGPGADPSEYSEVDKRLAANTTTTTTGVGFPIFNKDVKPPEFGHSLRDTFWQFERGWINLNHGN
jgi:hypothetical protein